MRSGFLFLLLLFIPITGYSLTGKSRISVLTSDPGVEYYTIFGHTAIRVTDDSLDIDRVYNFGTFDFSEPYFYFKFIKGNLKYFLSISDFKTFMSHSYLENRKVHEQILDLNIMEKNRLFNNLENCYNSSDKFYTYNFYYDNCATRVRDVIFSSTDSTILFNSDQYRHKTFRQLLKPYINENYWIDLGINIVLGLESDKVAKPNDYMFLPFYIMDILQKTNIVEEQNIILDASVPKINNRLTFTHFSPWMIIGVLLLLSIWSKSRKIAFFALTSVIGLTGLILLVVSIISENSAFSNNLNICWTIPSLIVVFIQNNRVREIVSTVYIILLVLIIVLWNYLPQGLSVTFIPWIICLIIMLLMNTKLLNRKKQQ